MAYVLFAMENKRIWQHVGSRSGPRGNDSPPKKVPAPTQKEIRLAAYLLWEKAGKPVNDGVIHWLEAERYLRWQDDRSMLISSIQIPKEEQFAELVPDPIFRRALKFTTWISYRYEVGDIVWRRGRWEKRHDKVTKQDEISFYQYGPGYKDYECTIEVYPAEEFEGLD